MRTALATAGQLAVAAVLAAVVALVSLTAIARVQWPAYPSSNQLHALTTVGQVGAVAGLVAAAWLHRHRRRLAGWAATVFVSLFATVTMAMPLGATKLYLFGISVDQQFRTEYLTRLTDSAALRDMTYQGLPPFYPPGWFWVGGRFAALTGTPGWEAYRPWAITSMTIAVALAWVLWQQMIRFEYALAVTTATAAVTLAYSSPEPYAAMITVLTPPVLVLAWSGLRAAARPTLPPADPPNPPTLPPERESGDAATACPDARFPLGAKGDGQPTGWAAVIGTGIFLGAAATCYTLLLVYTAFTVTLMALGLAAARHRQNGLKAALDPLRRLAVIAMIATALAATTWTPYLLRAATSPTSNTGSAQHYLPADGAELTFPMLQPTLLGALCLLGTLWLVARARSSTRAAALGFGVAAVYLWSLLSMVTTLARTTLLSFRLQPTLTVLLAAAGVFGFIEVARALAARVREANQRTVLTAAGAVGLAGAVAFSQDIPDVLRPDLIVAYTDTDGHGQRGDRRPPGAEKFYPEIDAAITAATGRPRDETVVLTADYSFLSYYPYFGFQGLTSHYANPLAQFDQRAAAIKSWAKLKTAQQFTAALDKLDWPAPTVFVLRRGAHHSYTLRLAEDVYPNQPNVRRYTVDFDAALFAAPQFSVQEIGPFVLAVRR